MAAHFILIPFLAQGHMIPMVRFAKLLTTSQPNITITLISTPVNTQRFGSALLSPHLNLLDIPFPNAEAGLPDGCENLDLVPSKNLLPNFFTALMMLRQSIEKHLRSLDPPASCIVSDMGLPWTSDTAQELGIPRFIFYATCCFSLLCSTNIRRSGILDDIQSDTEAFVVPGLGQRIEVTRSQLPDNFGSSKTVAKGVVDKIRESEQAARGVVVNSFDGLEPQYVEMYEKALGRKVWTIGPVSLGQEHVSGESECLRWLDSMERSSVLYVSFGTLSRQMTEQVIEIASGLEGSGYPFIWAVKSGELEQWLEVEGFEERNRGRCLILRGWVPQVGILSHPAVGGFLTHCGWNSTLEAVAAGVPMATWPLFAEQFFNEKLVVEVLGIGVSVGVTKATKWREEEETGVVARREEVERAVRELMGGSEEAEKRRRRARELGSEAKKAMEEGGTSCVNLRNLVEDVISCSAAPVSNE